MTETSIRIICKDDLKSLVRIHQLSFPGFLMTLMGPKFLLEYYRLILDYPKGIMLGIVNSNNELCGFIAGFVEPANFYLLLSKKKRIMVFSSFLYVVFRPKLWMRIWENMRKVESTAQMPCSGSSSIAELASIAVDPDFLRNGYGKKLVINFINCAKGMSVNFIELTTDMDDNSPVNEFYRSLGFFVKNVVNRVDGRRMYQYEYKISDYLNG